tara:strand:- start:795 stop:1115 length:321 start_codon:yes stop_codon:yes gene_type:complete
VALSHCFLPAAKWEFYEVTGGSDTVVAGVYMQQLYSVLKIATSNDVMEITIRDDDMTKLCITLRNEEKGQESTYKLYLLDLDEVPHKPKLTNFIDLFQNPKQYRII